MVELLGRTGPTLHIFEEMGFLQDLISEVRALRKEGLGGAFSGDVLQAASGVLTGPGLTLMRLSGPGRVGMQSMYMHHGSG